VAAHVHDAGEFLMLLHRGEPLDTDFTGEVPATIACHVPCHLRSQDVGLPSRDLLKLTGARVTLVQRCAGMGAMWGMRAANDEVSGSLGAALGDELGRAAADAVVSDCQLAAAVIAERTGAAVRHPLQVLARAYGIPTEAGG
jgi:glycerol-3-phosphate dehydrogenase subunit C